MNTETSLEARIKKLEAEAQIMRQISTTSGFYEYWFNNLPKYRTRKEGFETVNDMYFDFFGEYKYSSYESFIITNKNYKRRKK